MRLDAVSERLARLVRALLGASRIQAGRLELQCEPVDGPLPGGRWWTWPPTPSGHQILPAAPGHDLPG